MQNTIPNNYDELKTAYLNLQSRLQEFEEYFRLLQKNRFAAKSESLLHPGMKSLFVETEEQNINNEESIKKAKVTGHTRIIQRKPLPDSLIREEILCDLSESEKQCPCCQEQMCETHRKISEKLHVKPAEYVVKKYITPIYACKKCEEIKQGKLPFHPIPKCGVSIETLSYIAVSKYIDGLPLNRIENIFLRHQVEIKRDKMSRWIITLAQKLDALKSLLHNDLINSNSMAMDETSLQVLKEKGRTADQKSYMIVQAREGPPGQNITLFHYEKSRAAYVINDYLQGFQGSLITDGLASYQSSVSQLIGINHGGCLAHARRKFTDALKVKKSNVKIAEKAVLIMQKLFKIEKELKEATHEKILEIRQKESKPLMQELQTLWTDNIELIPKKSITGTALHYLKNQWHLLVKFLDDPKLPMHNNYLERQIRPFTIGRRAWLFSDTENGARASATFYSLLNTAKENGLNPAEYITYVLQNLGNTKDLRSLLPYKRNFQ